MQYSVGSEKQVCLFASSITTVPSLHIPKYQNYNYYLVATITITATTIVTHYFICSG